VEIGSASLLNRYFRIKETTISLTGADQALVAEDPARIALYVSLAPGTIGAMTTQPTATAATGLVFSATFPIVTLHYSDVGALVGRAWRVFGTNGHQCTTIEVFELPPADYFSAPGEVAPVDY
jgi:hypothetical protein